MSSAPSRAGQTKHGMDVVIVSSDKDMLQLVNDHVTMLNPMKDDFVYDAAETEKFMGVRPDQVADLLALKGDSIDNIPGAPGIGDKGAKDLIARFGSVEGALEHAAEVERKMYRESLQNNRDLILLSKKLATIHVDVPLPFERESLVACEPDAAALRELYRTLEFHRLLREMPAAVEAAPAVHQDYRALLSVAELEAWLPASGPVALAVEEVMSETTLALAARAHEARMLVVGTIPDLPARFRRVWRNGRN